MYEGNFLLVSIKTSKKGAMEDEDYVSKWEHAFKVSKTYNPLNATDAEIKRSAKQIFGKLVVGMKYDDRPI